MTDDKDYPDLLKALREVPADETGTGGVSIDRAIHTGRRTVRRRRILSGAAIVAVVVAASATPMLLDTLRTENVQPAGQNSRFDLWFQEFEVGSAGGFTPAEYQTGRDWQSIRLIPASAALGAATARVNLYAPGSEPQTDPVGTRKLEPIEGQPVYLLHQENGMVQVQWRYAEDGWGIVSVEGEKAATPDTARHIAESIHRAPRPVEVPFTVSRAAVGTRHEITGVVIPLGGSERLHKTKEHYELILHPKEYEQGGPGNGPNQLRVWVTKPAREPAQNREILGRPAVVTDYAVTMLDLPDGFTATAQSTGAEPPNPDNAEIAASVRYLPEGTDDPLR